MFDGCLLLRLIRHFGLVALAPPGRCHQGAVLAIGREHTVETGQIDSWFRNQGGEPRDEV